MAQGGQRALRKAGRSWELLCHQSSIRPCCCSAHFLHGAIDETLPFPYHQSDVTEHFNAKTHASKI